LEKQVKERTSQLRASIAELDAFSYSISHDLRSPLVVVEGFSRMLDEDYSEVLDEEGRKIIATIISSCRKMDKLINDLLLLSRTSREEINKSLVDMKDMALSVYQETLKAEASGHVSLEMGELHPAMADPALIRQVWQNLLSNALKYSRKSPHPLIRVNSHVAGESIIYSVEDNGVGFNPDHAHKIFTPFQRLHSAGDFEGNGVGLSIVQRIVHRHGGEVGAKGEENKGATFWFSLLGVRS
jgi:light-regulated signal transduction histidine kinase (bacteriophytochrome)